MMDLVIAMTPYVDVKNVKSLYDIVLPWLQVNAEILPSIGTLGGFILPSPDS